MRPSDTRRRRLRANPPVSPSQARLDPSRRPGGDQRQRGYLLLDLPIAWRLTIGFVLAALIAAAASGVPALQRAQALSRESSFYQSLLASNTSLTTGNSFLQLMNTEVHNLLSDASAPAPSRETLATDETAINGLADRYNGILDNYIHGSLLDQNASQVGLLNEAGHAVEVTQQRTLASSALRTWTFYRDAQAEVVHDVAAGDLTSAQALERQQGEPTNADSLSAVRALIQFNGRIAASIQDAALVEQNNQIVTAAIAAILACIAIGAVGWIISNTLVRRLSSLRRVTQRVEAGQLEERVSVVGRDEIAGVSASVNGMLDTIVGLLDVTRRQRDALTDAADRLFADMRLAGAGDLRVNAAVSSDPIGMLGNAFNFTIGRFRRFVLRTQTALDQLDVVSRRELERADSFLIAAQQHVRGGPTPSRSAELMRSPSVEAAVPRAGDLSALVEQIGQARELVREVARTGANYHARTVLDLAERAYLSAGRLNELLASPVRHGMYAANDTTTQALLEELRALTALLQRLGAEAHAILKTTGSRLGELDRALEAIPAAAQGTSITQGVGAPSSPLMSATTVSQVHDLVRLVNGFTQDVTAMARQVLGVTQELRAGLVPFRLEAGDAADRGEPVLNMSGSGFRERAEYAPFGRISQDFTAGSFYGQESMRQP